MKNLNTSPPDRSPRPAADRQGPTQTRDLGWVTRSKRGAPAERPSVDPVDRIPFTRSAADHWLR